ncbi:sulfatase-like hydrolase/transferase [Candidatus Nitrosopelagicus sp.]|nr:sulfatase-like hydrolase/transferase [Candidatus Nitrosopelagicus sp.]
MNKNVIIVCVDGGRLDRGRKSSIIKKFSDNSIFFSQSITYAPYTNSSIHALISGSYGNRNGCYSYWHSSRFKAQNFKTLVDYLHENDYYTCADLISDLVLPRKNFDVYEVYDESDVDLESRHIDLLEKMKEKNSNKKNFFLYLHYSGIHTGIRDQVLKVYNNFNEEYFENKSKNNQRYDNLFEKAEKYLERIYQKIKDLGLFKNSIVLVISDHGISIGEKVGERAYGSYCYDYTIKTFANYNSPNLPSQEFTQQVSHVDFIPTILDDLKIDPDELYEKMDGISLLDGIKNGNYKERYVFSETANPLNSNAPPKKPNTKSIRISEWKLIYNEHNNTKELYDLKNDPEENKNLIDKDIPIKEELWKNLEKNLEYRTKDDDEIPLSKRGLVSP